MKTLIAPTEDFIKRDRAQIASDVSSGSSVVVTLLNSHGFAVNDFVVLGIEGSQQAELGQISAISGQTITISTLTLSHKAGEPVVQYRYNKRKFYGSTTSGGTYAELTTDGSPVTISVNDPQGTVLEYAGVQGYLYFKSTYYNSQTTEETDIDDAAEVLADESVRYCSIYDIKKQAGLTKNPYITDGIIETYRKRAEAEVNTYLYARYVLPFENSLGTGEIPAVVENCTTLLAAGYMDYQEFGKDGEGVKWLGEARSILKKIATGELRLIDSTYTEFQEKTLTQGVESYPYEVNNTDSDGQQQKFSMNQVF